MSWSDGLGLAGFISGVILVVLDAAGKLKGPILLILLALAALMTVPFAITNTWVSDAPSGVLKFTRGLLLFFVIGLAYSGLAIWVSGDTVEDAFLRTLPTEQPPSGTQERLSPIEIEQKINTWMNDLSYSIRKKSVQGQYFHFDVVNPLTPDRGVSIFLDKSQDSFITISTIMRFRTKQKTPEMITKINQARKEIIASLVLIGVEYTILPPLEQITLITTVFVDSFSKDSFFSSMRKLDGGVVSILNILDPHITGSYLEYEYSQN